MIKRFSSRVRKPIVVRAIDNGGSWFAIVDGPEWRCYGQSPDKAVAVRFAVRSYRDARAEKRASR